MPMLCAQRNIRSLKQLVSMNDDDRRLLLRQLTDSEYRDVLSVCAMMPSVDITAHCEGLLSLSALAAWLWPRYVIGGPLYFCPVISIYLSSSSFFFFLA